ncbi:MAG: metallophosphoesterase family protein [Candidatus Omnitrophica bacterium]|nr:metallophosphoesterase family protein [Candidatus Omnitrophota bacterium]
MKIGVISDTHIPNRAQEIPEAIIQAFKSVDLILHAGDLVDLRVLESLKKIAPVRAVVGNMDHPDVVKILPKKDVIKIDNFRIGLIHGYGSPVGLEQRIKKEFEEKMDVIVFGHSHQPVNEVKDGILFFNPGSPTDKIFSSLNSFGIIEVDDKIRAKIITL